VKHIAIVGAGLAGLTASVLLTEAGYEVTLLERHKTPGGRIRRVSAMNGETFIDWGQHLMLGAYHHTLKLLDRLGTRNQLLPVTEATPFVTQDGKRRPYRIGRLPAPLHALPGLFHLSQLSVKDRLNLGRPMLAAKIQSRLRPVKLDRTTALDWLRRHHQTPAAIRDFWEPLALATLNTPLAEASALLLAVVLSKGFFARRTDAQPLLPTGTLHDLLLQPALDRIRRKNGRMLANCRVTGLEFRDGGAAGVQTAEAGTIRADAVILALPPWALEPVLKTSPALSKLGRITTDFEPSPIVSLELWYDRPWLRYPYAGLLGTKAQWIFNHQANGSGGGYRVSVVISAADDIELPREAFLETVIGEIRRYFPEARGAKVARHMLIRDFRATFRARAGLAEKRPRPETGIPNLFLAGDWIDTGLPGTMESAVKSGFMAAEAVTKENPGMFHGRSL